MRETDVRAAQQAGLRGVLVRAGKLRETDLDIEPEVSFVLKSVADLSGERTDRETRG